MLQTYLEQFGFSRRHDQEECIEVLVQPPHDFDRAAVAIFFGRSSFPVVLRISQADVIIHGMNEGFVGQLAMDRGADLNGDGYADVLINDYTYVGRNAGVTHYRGRLQRVLGSEKFPVRVAIKEEADVVFLPDTVIPGMFGYTWNWNGDGKMDLVIGDHYAGDADRHQHRGITYMFYNGYSFGCRWSIAKVQ